MRYLKKISYLSLSSKKLFLIGLLTTLSIISLSTNSKALIGVELPSSELAIVNGVSCGLIASKWVPGRVVTDGSFLTITNELRLLAIRIKRSSGIAKLKFQIRRSKLAAKRKKRVATCNSYTPVQPTPTAIALTPVPTATPVVVQTPLPSATTVAWSLDATAVNTQVGSEFLYFCPSSPVVSDSIYGTFTYTTDSSICVSAVHAGLISYAGGGNVKIKIKGNNNFYTGSVRNNITSSFYGSYLYSYAFLDLNSGAEITSTTLGVIPYTQTGSFFASYLGQTFEYVCEPLAGPIVSSGSVWGTDIYTSDSSICRAAVHAGVVTNTTVGGKVKFIIEGAQSSFTGTTRNGITSSSYGSYPTTLRFIP
jgi:hypothetical protein